MIECDVLLKYRHFNYIRKFRILEFSGIKTEVVTGLKFSIGKYKENVYFVDRFHGFALHGDRYTAGCEEHTNFADESACLAAYNILNEVDTIHTLQKVLKSFPSTRG
jgi:hypothetical protein